MKTDANQIVGEYLRGPLKLIDELTPEWERLCDNTPAAEPFYRPEYFRAYVLNFEPRQDFAVLTVRRNGELVAILPLVEDREVLSGAPVRLLRSPRDYHYPRFDGVCSSEAVGEIRSAMLRALRMTPTWDVLRIQNAPEGSFVTSLAADAQAAGLRSHDFPFHRIPYVRLNGWGGEWDWYVAQRSANFRHMVRQAKRRAEKEGQLSLKAVCSADPEVLAKVYAVEASGWKGKEGTAIVCVPALRQFYDQAAIAAERRGYLRMYLLELSGRTIAAMYTFESNGILYVPKIGFDEQFRKIAPGHLLVNYVLQDCASRGIREFDFLGPWMEWKAAWTDTVRPHSWCFIFQNNVRGRYAHWMRCTVSPAIGRLLKRGSPRNPESAISRGRPGSAASEARD